MTRSQFAELVENSFGRLLDEFRFDLIHEESHPSDYDNAIVVF